MPRLLRTFFSTPSESWFSGVSKPRKHNYFVVRIWCYALLSVVRGQCVTQWGAGRAAEEGEWRSNLRTLPKGGWCRRMQILSLATRECDTYYQNHSTTFPSASFKLPMFLQTYCGLRIASRESCIVLVTKIVRCVLFATFGTRKTVFSCEKKSYKFLMFSASVLNTLK